MVKNFERTQNPELWKRTKVGNSEGGEQELIDNLNGFVEDLDIVGIKDENLRGNRYKDEVNPWGHDVSNMDHFAFFKRAKNLGYVAIFSPYGGVREDARSKIEEYGYQRYKTNLYALDSPPHFLCPTMYKLIPHNKTR
jgi:hypothetical protein